RGQRQQLFADLRTRPETMLLVKSGSTLDELLRELPDSIEFVAPEQSGLATAGWVRSRSSTERGLPTANPNESDGYE
ncbi:MAG TPA: hypothetical protein VH643_27415, partial [Gemmataceae bacterium]